MHVVNSNSSCLHTLTQEEDSVLSLAATEKLLFSGGQGVHGSDIHVGASFSFFLLPQFPPLHINIQFQCAPLSPLYSLICNFKNVVIVCQSVHTEKEKKGEPILSNWIQGCSWTMDTYISHLHHSYPQQQQSQS
jgi:hypothetical protein